MRDEGKKKTSAFVVVVVVGRDDWKIDKDKDKDDDGSLVGDRCFALRSSIVQKGNDYLKERGGREEGGRVGAGGVLEGGQATVLVMETRRRDF